MESGRNPYKFEKLWSSFGQLSKKVWKIESISSRKLPLLWWKFSKNCIFEFFVNLGTFSVHDFVCLFKDYLVDCSNSDSEGRLEVTQWDLFSIFKFEKFKNWTIVQLTEINRGWSHGKRGSMAVKTRRCFELGGELLSVSLQDQTLWRDKKKPAVKNSCFILLFIRLGRALRTYGLMNESKDLEG